MTVLTMMITLFFKLPTMAVVDYSPLGYDMHDFFINITYLHLFQQNFEAFDIIVFILYLAFIDCDSSVHRGR